MAKSQFNIITQQALVGVSFDNWLNLLWRNGGIDLNYTFKALYITFLSFVAIPFRLFERLKFDQQIENTEITEPPIFIVGHWRSGTTYLHQVMARDQNLGYISSFQALMPEIFLGSEELWKPAVKNFWFKTRPMDGVSYSPDSPEEEEYAIANMTRYSFLQGWCFPKKIDIYTKYLNCDDLSDQEMANWEKTYLRILKKLTIKYQGKRIVLKNPFNTGKIEILLKLFPEAKFIHVYRNPYEVFYSSKKLYDKMLRHYQYQNFSQSEKEKNIFEIYTKIMKKFLETKELIPPDNFIEIKWEDFVGNELENLEKIYAQFNLPGFEEAKSGFKEYIEIKRNYQQKPYVIDEESQKKIYENWSFTIDKWQYEIPK